MQPFPLFAGLRLLRVGLHLLYGALQVALLFPLANTAQRQGLKSTWSQQLLTLLGIRLDFDLTDKIRTGSSLVIANHISFIDIFVINALLPCGFVAKSDVAQWPLIGWLSRHTDTVFIERGSRKAAHSTQQQMVAALDAGHRLAIFPEGTTTAGDRLLPFHGALFQSAIDAAVPVHALALSYRGRGGAPSIAPAYIDEISLLACLITVLNSGGLTARVTLAASFAHPLPDRRHLAHHAHQAVAAAMERASLPDPAQSLRKEAAIRR